MNDLENDDLAFYKEEGVIEEVIGLIKTGKEVVFETKRLSVIRGDPENTDHVNLLHRLWHDPRVMTMVGFPFGLRITQEEIVENLLAREKDVWQTYLLPMIKETGEYIGECKLGRPNENGLAETDVKLLPEFWGNKFGVEIKRGLLAYLFMNSSCQIVQATPNKKNVASIKMQEAVGGLRVGEHLFKPRPENIGYQCEVDSFIYWVTRENWELDFRKSINTNPLRNL